MTGLTLDTSLSMCNTGDMMMTLKIPTSERGAGYFRMLDGPVRVIYPEQFATWKPDVLVEGEHPDGGMTDCHVKGIWLTPLDNPIEER